MKNLHFWNNSFWFTADELADLFDVSSNIISDKLMQVYESDELAETDVSTRNKDGKLFLNLEAAISIAYRIDNVKATKFRIKTQKELLEKILVNSTNSTNSTNSSNSSNSSNNPLIPKHGGYQNLKSYQLTVIIHDATVVFCKRYISKFSRTVDQMVQAARSGKQNIAEGSKASGTSKKTEIKLINVARASLEELLIDYQDYLRQNDFEIWEKDNPEALKVRKLAYLPNKTYKTYKDYFESNSPELFANCAITIIHQANYLLDNQLKALDKAFLENGGFTENLYKKRTNYRKNNK